MDTSNNLKNFSFSIVQLRTSGLPEDGELADKAIQVIESIVQKIKPILRYITVPTFPIIAGEPNQFALCKEIVPNHYLFENAKRRRAVEIGRNPFNVWIPRILYLGEDGKFFEAEECLVAPSDSPHFHSVNVNDIDACWIVYPVDFLINKIQAVLHEATAKREKHLASITERSVKLDQIMEILKS